MCNVLRPENDALSTPRPTEVWGARQKEQSAEQRQLLSSSFQAKKFKACRTCKRQKMKCDGQDNYPCYRCKAARIECIFDPVVRQRRRGSFAKEADAEKGKLLSLENEVKELKDSLVLLVRSSNSDQDVALKPGLVAGGKRKRPFHAQEKSSRPRAGDYSGFTSTDSGPSVEVDLISPVAEMDPNSGTQAGEALQEPEPFEVDDFSQAILDEFIQLPPGEQTEAIASPTLLVHNKSGSYGNSSSRKELSPTEDLITKGLVSEDKARSLYGSYLARSCLFLPLFDPSIDHFESMRLRSTFCFTAIISVASHGISCSDQSHEKIRQRTYDEARNLAAQTLFEGTPKIETLQGMILLAAYSERCWYAVGHAVRMAQQLHLDQSLSKFLAYHFNTHTRGSETSRTATARLAERSQLIREARTWITLVHLEREVASVANKDSLIDSKCTIDTRMLIEHHLYPHTDWHILGKIEINQLRDEFVRQARCSDKDRHTSANIDVFITTLDDCFSFWDALLAEMGHPKGCLQRNFLDIQRCYAVVSIYCALFARHRKLEENSQNSIARTDETIADLLSRIASSTQAELASVFNIALQRLHFNELPTYCALMISSAAAVALRISATRPELCDPLSITQMTKRIEAELHHYPFGKYYRILEVLLGSSPDDPDPKATESIDYPGLHQAFDESSGEPISRGPLTAKVDSEPKHDTHLIPSPNLDVTEETRNSRNDSDNLESIDHLFSVGWESIILNQDIDYPPFDGDGSSPY